MYDYQESAKTVIVRALVQMARTYTEQDDVGAVVLAAPTGAGKTVIATAVIEAAMDGDAVSPPIDEATFLWVTDDPSLNQQTLHKMVAASSALSVNRLRTIENDFDEEIFQPQRVYFLNVQKLSSTATLAKGGTNLRRWSLWDTIANTVRERPGGFVVVIDEAHRGMGRMSRTARETIVSQIIGGGTTGRPPVPVVWGISATPKRFRDQMADRDRTVKSHTVPIEDVRQSGLLKDQIVLGHTRGVDAAESTLVRHAVNKIRDYESRWNAYCADTGEPQVRPVLVVQVEDKPTQSTLGEIVDTVLDEWPGLTVANIVHVFGVHTTTRAGRHDIRWCPPEDIQDRSDVRVVLCMTAITTGWDCPRAEVLVSLRVARDEDLVTQIMGRMVRTPLARRIESDITLNAVHCVLPRFNAGAVDSIAAQFEKGDDGIAGGTEVVTEEVDLTRNPTLGSSTPSTRGLGDADGRPYDSDAHWASQEHRSATAATVPSPSPSPGTISHLRALTADDEELLTHDPGENGPAPAVTAQAGGLDIFSTIESLPTYTIPSRSPGSSIARAFRLAALLSFDYENGPIDLAARRKVLNRLLGEIDGLRQDLEADGTLEDRIENVAQTDFYERSVTYGTPTILATGEARSTLTLDERGLRILMSRARRALPEGLIDEYVAWRAPDDEDVPDAIILAIALAQDRHLPDRVEDAAASLTSDWLQRHHSAITRLPEAAREDFDRVRRQSSRPEPTNLTIPPRANGERRGRQWERHVLSDTNGKYRADLNPVEEHILQTELSHGAVAWYRNPSTRPKNAVVIPWQKWDGWHGMHPDFIFVNRVGGTLRASLIDPHGAYMQDAIAKLRGLSNYVNKHPAAFHRVQSVDLLAGHYRMLDLMDPTVREAIINYRGEDSDDAAELYDAHGRDF